MAGGKDLVIAGTRRLGDDSLLKTSLLLRSMDFFDIFFYTIFRLCHSIFYFSHLSEGKALTLLNNLGRARLWSSKK
jgi:hypothetical protein